MKLKIKFAGAALQGRSHDAKKIYCQDAVFFQRFRGKRSAIIALADGAGSCSHADIGARLVVSKIGGIIKAEFSTYYNKPANAAGEIIEKLRYELNKMLPEHMCTLQSFASTLLFVYVRKMKRSLRFIAGHLGDGIIAFKNSEGLSVLSHPDNGEFANETVFVTSANAAARLRIYTGVLSDDAGFLLFSDGTAACLYSKRGGSLAPACSTILEWLNKLPQKKAQKAINSNLEKVFKQATSDDCSIVALHVVGLQKRANRKK